MRSFNLDQLRAFTEVIERGSFSAAAERLNLTQPAVSQQVRELERRLGVRLLERVGRRATPTAAGSALLAHAAGIEASVAGALEAVAPYAGGGAGRVRLGTGATACIYLLPPVLRELRRARPALEIVVETGNTSDVLKAVEENRLDLGLVTLPASGRMLQVTPLLDEEFVAIAAAEGGGEALPAEATPAALARLPLVLYEAGGNTRRIVDDWFAQAGIAPKPVMELGSVEAIKELVGVGLGCAVLPSMAVRRAGSHAPLLARSLSPPLHRTLALVVRRDKPLHQGLREVLEALRAIA